MSKINSMMDVGRRSMSNSQTALQTVSHNIANKSTEGYSRQRVDLVTNEPIGLGKLRIGMGARATNVSRINNPFLEKQLGKEEAQLGYLNGKNDAMVRVEQVYNEQVNKGLNSFMGEFFNSFRELANSPESAATRTLVKETAEFLTRDFKRVNTQLKAIQGDIDQQLQTQVEEINGMTQEIANLNQKIQSVELSGTDSNDERDRRDLLIKKLGEKINIRWAEGEDRSVTISAGSSAILVAGYDAKKLSVMATPETDNKGEGNVDVFYQSNDRAIPMKVTEQITGGSMGGLLEVRDQTIAGLLGNLDDMAYSLADSVNEVHNAGFNAYNKPAGNFFAQPTQVRHASEFMKLERKVSEDPNMISTAATPFAPGDNRVANAVSQLQFEKFMSDGNATLDDFYNGMVGRVGVFAKRTETARAAQKESVKQLNNIRESISGVSLDEETTKMIEFQKGFAASARLIRTADEMFDTVLNLRR